MNDALTTSEQDKESPKSIFSSMPQGLQDFFNEAGDITRFALRFFREVFFPPFEFREILRQCYEIGYRSFPLVGLTAFIIGLVITLQSRPTLVEFGAEAWLPKMVGISIIREIGPVIVALICKGKIGSSIGAEFGSMKVIEQIDAMEVGGTNPFKYILVSRIISTTLMVPLLFVSGVFVALCGSFLAVNKNETFTPDEMITHLVANATIENWTVYTKREVLIYRYFQF